MISKEDVLHAMKYVIEPDLKKDLVELDLVSNIEVNDKGVSFEVKVSNPAMHNKKRMEEACIHAIDRFFKNVGEVNVTISGMEKSSDRSPELRTVLPNIKNIIAVASGKGGVGKSTVASNVAVALVQKGFKVGFVDADIYGPSAPIMFNVQGEKPLPVEKDGKNMMAPVESYGVKILSIGFFTEPDQAVAWRGPMVSKALNQMFLEADWGSLDFLIIDMPPGTGDVHLSLVQTIPLTGAIIVTTPQDIALADAKRGVAMFGMDTINVKVLGLVENMAYFTPTELPDNKYYIFGQEGGKKLAEQMKVPLLAEIPLIQSIREASDAGRPASLQNDTISSKVFDSLCDNILKQIDLKKATAATE